MTREIRHPIFARFFVRLSRGEEKSGVAEFRRELLRGLSGRVVEIGAGNGLNFPHYPEGVEEVIAVEPEAYLRTLAKDAAQQAPVPVEVVAGRAEELPLDEASFDAAVVSCVLCSVDDVRRGLAEIRRVLRPAAELRFWEHVRAEEPRLERLQRVLDHAWHFFAGGCHLTRDTASAIESAGFAIEHCRRFRFQPCLLELPTSPQILGIARNTTLSRSVAMGDER
jgi:ubiquinone/menaquinone biosynthesis C-methylase UbiE